MAAAKKTKATSRAKKPDMKKRRNIIVSVVVGLLVVAAGLLLTGTFAGSEPQLIRVTSSSVCLQASGSRVYLATCKTSDKTQQWTLSSSGSTTIKSISAAKCMNVASRKDNAPVQLGSCNSTTTQKWYWSGGHIYNGTTSSSPKLCFGTVGGNKQPGSELHIYTCKSASKTWYTVKATGSSSTTTTPPSTSSTSKETLARQILSSKLGIQDYSASPSRDSSDRSLASQQLTDIANGKPAKLSSRCSYASQLPSSIQPDVKLLQFLADLGKESGFKISVLFGQCHSGPGSNHHKGKAVDLGCPVNTTIADRIGAKYGVRRNSESCAADSHYHYSVGGN